MTIGKEQKTVVVIDVPIPAHALAHILTYIHTQLIRTKRHSTCSHGYETDLVLRGLLMTFFSIG